MTGQTEVLRLLAERDRLIARNMDHPEKRNETRIWNINLRLAELNREERAQ